MCGSSSHDQRQRQRSHSQFTPTCCVMPAASSSPKRTTTPDPCSIISGTRTSLTPCDTRILRRIDSRVSGGTESADVGDCAVAVRHGANGQLRTHAQSGRFFRKRPFVPSHGSVPRRSHRGLAPDSVGGPYKSGHRAQESSVENACFIGSERCSAVHYECVALPTELLRHGLKRGRHLTPSSPPTKGCPPACGPLAASAAARKSRVPRGL